MTHVRKVDKAATKEARARQKRGIAELDKLFRIPSYWVRLRGLNVHHSLRGVTFVVPRTRATTPPDRDPEAKARHLKRKRARAARRANRAA